MARRATSSMPPAIPGKAAAPVQPVPFGAYLLLRRVATGGMAEVYKAKAFGAEGFERFLAVKKILPGIAEDDEFTAMFIDEAKIAAQLTHAHIAQVFDLGRVDQDLFIAMEYVPGRNLRSLTQFARTQGHPLPLGMACYVLAKACEGLDYAHNRRSPTGETIALVHRDISPQNILVSYEGEVKVIDFGIAKAAGKISSTQSGMLKGKFGYMSPEQVQEKPLDHRSDIFGVGICLYELLTGQRLFDAENDLATVERIQKWEGLGPTSKAPAGTASVNAALKNIPQPLVLILRRALAPDPQARYSTAMELHDDLQAFMYTTDNIVTRADVSAHMYEHFKDDIQREQRENERYRHARPWFTSLGGTPEEQLGLDDFEPTHPRNRGPARAGLAQGFLSNTGAGPLAHPDGPTGSESDPSGGSMGVHSSVRPSPKAFQQDASGRGAPVAQDGSNVDPRIRSRAARRRLVDGARLGILGALTAIAVAVFFWVWQQPRTGTLQFSTEPFDALVQVNGTPIASKSSPFIITDLSPLQVHEIIVKRPGYTPWSTRVQVPAGQVHSLPLVRLNPERGRLGTTLSLLSIPRGAEVIVDGKPTGHVTPAQLDSVEPGIVEVVLQAPGCAPWRATIQVSAHGTIVPTAILQCEQAGVASMGRGSDTRPVGRPTQGARPTGEAVRTTVAASPSATGPRNPPGSPRQPSPPAVKNPREGLAGDPPPPVADVPQPSPVAGSESPGSGGAVAREPTMPRGHGALRLNTQPWTTVYIDGQLLGTTPVVDHFLKAGSHKLTLVNDDYNLRRDVTVRIQAGQTTTKVVRLN